jgi:protocatechuate 3,4-dioxygenase beta subunit
LLNGVCEGPVQLQLTFQSTSVTVETTGGTTDIVLRLPNYRNNNNLGWNPVVAVADPVVKISGTVRDAEGAPAAGVAVMWGNSMNQANVTTDSRGHYSITWPKGAGELVMLARDEERNLAATREVDGTVTNVDLRLDPGCTISLTVRDMSGRPIPSALATLALVMTNSQWAITRGHARADERGRIEIKGVPQGMSYRCIVTSRGFGMVTAVMSPGATLTPRREIPPAVLKVADYRVAGRVFDRDNKPSARLTVNMRGDQSGAVAATDDRGRFAFDGVCEGEISLSAGGASARVEAGDTNVVLRFPTRDERGFDISTEMVTTGGRVLDSSGGPVPNVLLTVLPDGGRRTEVVNDPDGQFMIGWRKQYCFNDGQMPPTIIARDPEHNLVGLHDLDGKASNVDLTLEPGLTLAIKAQDTKGNPIPVATGVLYAVSGNWTNRFNEVAAQSDARGAIEFKGLPHGWKYRVTVAAKGYGVANLEVEPAQTRTNRYDFPAAVLKAANRNLAGHLFDARGNPTSTAVVILDGEGQPPASAIPDDRGRFSFGAVCDGPVRLLAGYSAHSPPVTNIEAQAGDTDVVIRFQPAGQMVTTRGRVLDPSGAPVPGAHLTVVMAYMEGGKDARSDADGAFSIVWMSMNSTGPAGAAGGANLPPLPYALAAVDDEHGLTAAVEIDRTTTNVDLHLQKPMTLTGSVLDSEGKPVANPAIVLCIGRREPVFIPQQTIPVDAQGAFSISNLPPGQQYRVTVKAGGHADASRRLEAVETQTASLKLKPFVLPPANLKLEGTVVDAKDRPVTRAQVMLPDTNQPGGICLTDSNGQFHFDQICEGPAILRASYDMDGRIGSAIPSATVQAQGGDTNILIKLVLTNALPAAVPPL